MAKYNFSNEESLGKVVSPACKVFCNWSPKTPIKNVYKVTRDVCGHKFSTICGFTFTSALDAPFFVVHPELGLSLQNGIESNVFYPTFQIVYCPKSRSNYVRNDRGLSGWYIWQHRAADDKQILSMRDLYAYYGFDISKFFQSDMFEKFLPKFGKQITAAFDTVVKDFVEGMGDTPQFGYTKRDAKFFSQCVRDSLEKIGDVLKVNWEKPEEMKAKLAYNANDTYSLNGKNVSNLDQVSGVDATGTAMDKDIADAPTDEAEDIVEEGADEEVEEADLLLGGDEEIAEDDITEEGEDLEEADASAEDLWAKVQAKLPMASRALEDIDDYVSLASKAHEKDKETVSSDDEGMEATEADLKKAAEAASSLRQALHISK